MLPVSLVDCVDSEIDMLMPLDLELAYLHDWLSSRTGESILRSLSVPNILCAFDMLFPEALARGFAGSVSLVEACFRPGIGNENLEVRPIVYDSLKPRLAALDG